VIIKDYLLILSFNFDRNQNINIFILLNEIFIIPFLFTMQKFKNSVDTTRSSIMGIKDE
jgi:hypothetical protein